MGIVSIPDQGEEVKRKRIPDQKGGILQGLDRLARVS
jgi:hypothetical protein